MSDSYTKQMFDAIEIEVKPLIAERDALFDDNERLGDRIVVLTAERDDYMLKQKVWEAANDELRSEHIRVTARIRDLEALLDECYESGRAPTSDELDRLKIPTASETPAEPIDQAPIARVVVTEDAPAGVVLYAPGLPPGEFDVYLEPASDYGEKK